MWLYWAKFPFLVLLAAVVCWLGVLARTHQS
jgi:hypothetical protein